MLAVGVFTGASSLAAALYLPPDGKVMAMDVSAELTQSAVDHWAEAGVASKIELKIAPAVDSLNSLITAGEAGTYDFAFIDADKTNYMNYYELCLTLLRKGKVFLYLFFQSRR